MGFNIISTKISHEHLITFSKVVTVAFGPVIPSASAAAPLSQGDLKVRAQPVSLRHRGRQGRRRRSKVQMMPSAEG